MATSIVDVFGLGVVAASATATYGFFHWFGSKEVSDEAKLAVSRWFDNKKIDVSGVSKNFNDVFERIYSSPLLSWRAFKRSAIFSSALCVLFYAWWMFSEGFPRLNTTAITVDAFVLLSNIFSDYVSLFIVRHWLSETSRSPFGAFLKSLIAAISVIVLLYGVQMVALAAGTILLSGKPKSWSYALHVLGLASDGRWNIHDMLTTTSCGPRWLCIFGFL
jgi:hypothetical protein